MYQEHRKFLLKRDKFDERDLKIMRFPVETRKLPKSMNLLDQCPPVFDQGNLGSCTAQTGVAAHMMMNRNRYKNMSRLFLYYVMRVFSDMTDCDSGCEMRDIGKALTKVGVCSESTIPYDERKFTNTPSMDAYLEARQYLINAYSRLSALSQIKQWIAFKEQPVMIGMDCYKSMLSNEVANTGILPMPKSGEECVGGHAVLIVGYQDSLSKGLFGSSKGYLVIRNSWGDKWGIKGYFHMPYEYVESGLAYDIWTIQ